MPTKVEQGGQYTVRAYYDTVETSFIMYAQVLARPETMKVAGTTIAIADVGLQAAMKAAALHDRGARRDFIDIHAIAALPGWSLAHFIERAAQQLPLAPEQVARALTYFVDAEKEPIGVIFRGLEGSALTPGNESSRAVLPERKLSTN